MSRSRLITLTLGALAVTAALPAPTLSAETPTKCERCGQTSRLVLLGTGGGPVVRQSRSQPASVIQLGGRLYLIDTGDGVARQLAAAGLGPADVDAVFYTHLHLDHTLGLTSLLGLNWMTQKAKRYAIFGPPGTSQMVSRAAAAADLPASVHGAGLRSPSQLPSELVTVTEKEVDGPVVIYRDAQVTVTAVANNHYATELDRMPERTRSYSYRFDLPDRSIVFTGDTGPDERVAALAKGADVLVSEVMDMLQAEDFVRRTFSSESDVAAGMEHMHRRHLSPEDVGRLAQSAGVKMVVLSHIGMAPDGETDVRNYSDGVRRFYAGPVVVGTDLLNL